MARSVIWTSTAIANRKKVANFDHLFCFQTSGSSGAVPTGGEADLARYCERRGAWQHGVAQVRRRGSIRARRHGAAQVQRCEKARVRCGGTMCTRHHGAARVQWCGKARARRCGVMQVWCLERTRRYAMGWRGFGAVGCARCGVIGKCGVRWRLIFRFGCQNGQIAKSFQNFIGKTHLKKIFLDGAGTAKYFIKLCLFAKQPVATKEEMTRGSV